MSAIAMKPQAHDTVARYESVSGKHWAELRSGSNEHGCYFYYSSPSCGGTLAAKTLPDALAEMNRRIQPGAGYFQPDANKTAMRRVF